MLEECCWWIKAKLTSEESVQHERAKLKFEAGAKLELLKGCVFEWKRPTQSTGATALLSSALSSLSKLSGSDIPSPTNPTVQVMLRLQFPDKTKKGAPDTSMMTKITEMVYQEDNTTALTWTSLELEQNKPKHAGRVPLHVIQTVKERDGWLVLADHQNRVLFEGKSDQTATWVSMLQETLKVLAPQIEDEAAASRGVTYRSEQLERLETRNKEREERKKTLGPVTMAYTAQAMMRQGGKVLNSEGAE